MIVDTPEPRDVVLSGRRRWLKRGIMGIASDIMASIRGDEGGRARGDPLDDTRPLFGQAVPPNDSEFRINDRRAQIPQWLLLVIIIQGGSGIWWAATMQSDLRNLEREYVKLWERIETADLQRDKMLEIMRENVKDEVKDEVTDQLLSRGILRVQPGVE